MSANRLISFLVFISSLCSARALVMSEDTGKWPTNWPSELEAFRKQCHTTGVATGIQENIYDIYFTNRAQFHRAWPAILKVRTPGSPIAVYSIDHPPKTIADPWPMTKPTVRIYAPTDGYVGGSHSQRATNLQQMVGAVEAGQMLHAGAPWPQEISTNGTLPKYVVAKEINGRMRWVPADLARERPIGFYNRARIEVAIIADGRIINMNEIILPPDAEIRTGAPSKKN